MYAIAQSMNKPIWATYLYLSLIESLAIMMNTRQQNKEVLVEYMDGFKKEKNISKSSIGEKNGYFCQKQLRNLRNLMKWMTQMKELIRRKMYLKHGQRWFSWEYQTGENMGNWYMIYPFITRLRTINIRKHSRKQWKLRIKWNLNQKRIIIKVTHKNRIQMEVVIKIYQMKRFFTNTETWKSAIAVVQERTC